MSRKQKSVETSYYAYVYKSADKPDVKFGKNLISIMPRRQFAGGIIWFFLIRCLVKKIKDLSA